MNIRAAEVWMYFQLHDIMKSVQTVSPTQESKKCPEISAMFMTPFKRKVSETSLCCPTSRKRQAEEHAFASRASSAKSSAPSCERVPQDRNEGYLDGASEGDEEGQEGDEDSEDNADDGVSVGEGASDNGEECDPQSEFVTSIILQPNEWEFINQRKAPGFLRSFKSKATCLEIMIRPQSGHQCVGRMLMESCRAITIKVAEKKLGDMYTKQQWNDLKSKEKEVYFWLFKELDSFEKPHLVRFLDLAPRFRNRPFKIKREILASSRVGKHPSKLCLFETARFFFQQLPITEQEHLVRTLRHMNGGTIRIGTTCSGTDICVAALIDICNFMNQSEARCIWHKMSYI